MSDDNLAIYDFFPATRDNGLARLEAFADHMARTYAEERNTDYGPERRPNVSCLSPFHSHRLILEKETVAKALEAHDLQSAEKFIQEVYWRTYFKGWLELHPSVWTRYKADVSEKLEGLTSERRKAYEAACAGETEIECFNAWAADLVERGYLHNHARMWFASIWIFTLQLPWSLGADFFYRHLLDGDAASNTLSWRWVAGLHTSGKNYAASASNIAKFTDGRYDPSGQLAKDPAPLSDDWNGEPGSAPGRQNIDEGAKTLLLLHEDDLGFDSLDLSKLDLAGVAGITVTDDRSPLGVSELVKQFTIDAVEDALNRADDSLPVNAEKLLSPQGLVDHAKSLGATQVVYPYAPVGPVQDRLNAAKPDWEAAGIKSATLFRDEDLAAWPHCGKGFFKLKEEIPQLIKSIKS